MKPSGASGPLNPFRSSQDGWNRPGAHDTAIPNRDRIAAQLQRFLGIADSARLEHRFDALKRELLMRNRPASASAEPHAV